MVLKSVLKSAVTSAPCATGLFVLPRAPLVRLVRRRRLSCLLSHARRRVYRPTVAIRAFRRLLIVPPTCSTRCRFRSRSPLRGRVRRPTVLTTQRRRRYSRPQRFPPRSQCALLAWPTPPPFLLSPSSKRACPLSTFPSFKPHSTHTGTTKAPQLPTPVAFNRSSHPRLLSVYSLSFRATVGFQSSWATGL